MIHPSLRQSAALIILSLVACLVLLGAGLQPDEPLAVQKASPTYDDVAPVFEDNCIMCHNGPKAPKGLRLDSYESLLKGSER
ncbi:MAG: hypothetical protein HW412_2137, partial [Bacteroidetes bacterium]|nr:hypothetical protein [Bacteroidota bacterium]